MTPEQKTEATRAASLASGGALQHYYAERRKQAAERRRTERSTVGRRVGDIAAAILHTNRKGA